MTALAAILTTPADAAWPRRFKAKPPAQIAKQIAKSRAPAREERIAPGPHIIVVSIANQRVALYGNGELAAQSAVSTGMPGYPTPTGVFSVIQKSRHHRSNIYSGAPMPFMQRITWSGVALHQGVLPGRPASHGCIRVSADFAQLLWKTTRLGARVVVARDEVSPYEFTHPRLAALQSPDKTADLGALRIAEISSTATQTATDAAPGAPASAGPADPDKLDLKPSLTPAAPMTHASLTLEAEKETPEPSGPVSIFISTKEQRLFVRQGMLPLFEAPIAIADPSKPVGTHVFTLLGGDKSMHWAAISLPPDQPKPVRAPAPLKPARAAERQAPAPAIAPTPKAADILDRIEWPKEALARMSALMIPGSSLIVSDHGLGDETGDGTDFIVLTR